MYTSHFDDEKLKITLDTVLERDMDLLIMEEFLSNKAFANLFLDATNIDRNSEIISVQRSLRFQMGESDIVIVLKTPSGTNIGLHIEDKVNAEAQQEQYGRYEERAALLANDLDYSEHRICITAPQHYLDTNTEAQKYPASVSYERIRDYFEQQTDIRAKFKLALLHCALGKKDSTIAVPNAAVTSFWGEFERLAASRGLAIKSNREQHGKESKFIRFHTAIQQVYVIYKARHGYIDLQFPHMAGNLSLPPAALDEDMFVYNAGKSAVVRISNPQWVLDLEETFDNNIDILNDILDSVARLEKLAAIILKEYRVQYVLRESTVRTAN